MAKAQLTTDERETMRQRLSDAATAIYREQGVEAVSFRKLAESVGLSHTLPYLYFDNKDALLARMRKDGVDRFGVYLRAREQAGEPPKQRLQALILGVLDFVREHPADYQLIFSTQQPPPDRYPELLAARRDLFDHIVEVVAGCVAVGLLEGEPRELTHGFWAALHGLMSLHVANQLVHGYSMDQLVWPMIKQMFGFVIQPEPQAQAPRRKRAQSSPATIPTLVSRRRSTMSKAIVPLDALSARQRARFKQLTSAPVISWPTAISWVLLTVTFACTYWFCGTGRAPLWLGLLANSLVGYVSFSVIHDSIHRAISSNARVNDAVGQAAMLLVLPYVDVRLFRWLHNLHHRYATGPLDPDRVLHGAWWTLPFRWMAIDLIYFVYALRHADKISRPYLRTALALTAVAAVVVGTLIAKGYGPAGADAVVPALAPDPAEPGLQLLLAAARAARHQPGGELHPCHHHPPGLRVAAGPGVAVPELPPDPPPVPDDAVLQQLQGVAAAGAGAAQEGPGDPARLRHRAGGLPRPRGLKRQAQPCAATNAASARTSTTNASAIRTAALSRAPASRTFRTTGSARSAEPRRATTS